MSSFNAPATDTLAYSQGGGRLTAAIGGKHDLGVQYFTGGCRNLRLKWKLQGASRYRLV